MIQRRLRLRVTLVRTEVPGAQGSAALSSGSAGLGGGRQERAHVGIFMGDYFARPTKRSGAWMSAFRTQHKLGKGQSPIIVNVLNFAKGGEGEPALLSFDDARTLFHEFGHGLHGLLSNVTYPSISGTVSVARFRGAAVAALRALAVDAGSAREACPALQDGQADAEASCGSGWPRREISIRVSRRSSTRHRRSSTWRFIPRDGSEIGDVEGFERMTLASIDMPKEIVMRHRLPHFMHIMSGYAAGYYSYLVVGGDGRGRFCGVRGNRKCLSSRRRRRSFTSSSIRPATGAIRMQLMSRFADGRQRSTGLLKKRGLAA